MRFRTLLFTGFCFIASLSVAQQSAAEKELMELIPYSSMKTEIPGLTYDDYRIAIREVASTYALPPSTLYDTSEPTYLGRLSTNQYDSESISNPYGVYGSQYSPHSINNPYSEYGNPYSPGSVSNPYALSTPSIYGSDGTYLGKLSSNPYDPESISNPYGQFGSPYSPTSINNPYSVYGNPYSSESATNPYSISPPLIIDFDK